MTERLFKVSLTLIIAGFTIFFFLAFLPPILTDKDIFLVLSSGFVNPYAAGYSIDLIACWLVLIVWVWHEAAVKGTKHGWVCIILGLAPGVVVGFASYLLLRNSQLSEVIKADS